MSVLENGRKEFHRKRGMIKVEKYCLRCGEPREDSTRGCYIGIPQFKINENHRWRPYTKKELLQIKEWEQHGFPIKNI